MPNNSPNLSITQLKLELLALNPSDSEAVQSILNALTRRRVSLRVLLDSGIGKAVARFRSDFATAKLLCKKWTRIAQNGSVQTQERPRKILKQVPERKHDQVPSLLSLTIFFCKSHFNALRDISGVPSEDFIYEILKGAPAETVQNIQSHTKGMDLAFEPLWKGFCIQKYHKIDSGGKSWRQVYLEEEEQAAERIRDAGKRARDRLTEKESRKRKQSTKSISSRQVERLIHPKKPIAKMSKLEKLWTEAKRKR